MVVVVVGVTFGLSIILDFLFPDLGVMLLPKSPESGVVVSCFVSLGGRRAEGVADVFDAATRGVRGAFGFKGGV